MNIQPNEPNQSQIENLLCTSVDFNEKINKLKQSLSNKHSDDDENFDIALQLLAKCPRTDKNLNELVYGQISKVTKFQFHFYQFIAI